MIPTTLLLVSFSLSIRKLCRAIPAKVLRPRPVSELFSCTCYLKESFLTGAAVLKTAPHSLSCSFVLRLLLQSMSMIVAQCAVNDRRSMRLVFGAKAVQNYNHFLNYQNFFALFLKKKFTTKNKSTPIYIIIYNLLLSQQRFSCPGANRRLTPPQRKKFFEKR